MAPFGVIGLAVVHAFNVAIVFAMASYTARFYYSTVRRVERKLVIATSIISSRSTTSRGTKAATACLRAPPLRCCGVCRALDIVARWGGEEFLLVLPATTLEAAAALAERIRLAVTETKVEHGGIQVGFTLSLDVTVMSTDEPLFDAIARADGALYKRKSEGRNRVTVAST